jgi:hypothetical protein
MFTIEDSFRGFPYDMVNMKYTVSDCRMVDELEEIWSWPNRSTFLAFVWRDIVKPQKKKKKTSG